MDCKRIVNGYEWICIRLRHFVILHKTSCTRQFESTLSLRSFALSLHPSSADVISNAADKMNHYQLQKLSKQ